MSPCPRPRCCTVLWLLGRLDGSLIHLQVTTDKVDFQMTRHSHTGLVNSGTPFFNRSRRQFRPYPPAELPGRHLLDLSDGPRRQLLQYTVQELPAHLAAPLLGDHRVHAVVGPRAPAGLLLGDLVGEQPVAHHEVALRDVESLLRHAGGDEEVEGTLAEVADGVPLLILRRYETT